MSVESHTAEVLVVDDHPLVAHGLEAMIENERGLSVCGTATTAGEAIRLFEACEPDVVVLDLRLPDESGLRVLARMLALDPAARILVFSSLDPAIYSARARRIGAARFVHKSTAIENVVPAIHDVLGDDPR